MSELNTSYDNNMADQIDPPKKSNRTFKPTHLATKQGRSGMSGVYGATSTALLGVNTGLGNSTYDKNLSWFGDVDQKDVQGSINEHRYEQQGWGTQLAAGVGRAATKALSEVAKLPFVVGGAIAAPFVEDGQGYDTVFNNQFIKSIDSINEEINTEMLPVYVGKAIKDGNLWDAVTSTSFWATDGADGLGFLIGMMAPGAVFSKMALGAKMLNAGRRTAQLVGMADKTEKAVSILKGAGISGAKAIDIGLGATANTIFEAGAEAAGVGNDLDSKKQKYIDNYSNILLSKLKRIDERRQSGELTIEEANKLSADTSSQTAEESFTEQRATAMRDTFKTNLAILIVPNMLMSKALFGKAPSKLLASIEKTGMARAKEVTKAGAKRIGSTFASEGFLEEAGQSTAQNLFTKKAMQGELDSSGNYITGGLQDTNISEVVDEYANTVASTEGQKAIFLGGILGSPITVVQGYKGDIQSRKDTNSILSKMDTAISSYNTIFENDVYKRDPKDPSKFLYKKDIDGNDTTVREIDKRKALNVAKSLKFNEEESARLDEAIRNGDSVELDRIQKRAIFDLIQPSIFNGQAGIDALELKLKESSKYQEIAARDADTTSSENSLDYTKRVLETARHLQKEHSKFQDYSEDLIKLADVRGTSETKAEFLNMLEYQYLNAKHINYNAKADLIKFEEKRDGILQDLNIQRSVTDISDNNRQVNEAASKNPVLAKVLSDINVAKAAIEKTDNDVNDVWSGKNAVEGSFSKYLDKLDKEEALLSETKVKKAETIINKIKAARTNKELGKILLPEQLLLPEQAAGLDGKRAYDVSHPEYDNSDVDYENELQFKIVQDAIQSLENDPSNENISRILNTLKSVTLSSPAINDIIESLENKLQADMEAVADFKDELENMIDDHSETIDDLKNDLEDVNNDINELLDQQAAIVKSLSEENPSPRGRNAKLIKALIAETKRSLKDVETRINALNAKKAELETLIETANKELSFIFDRYNQADRLSFESVEDIVTFINKYNDKFGIHRFSLARLLTSRHYAEEELAATKFVADELTSYRDVIRATLQQYVTLNGRINAGTDPETYKFLRDELMEVSRKLIDANENVNNASDMLARLNKAVNDKQALDSIKEETAFWKDLKNIKERLHEPMLRNKVIADMLAAKREELKAEQEADALANAEFQRQLEEEAILEAILENERLEEIKKAAKLLEGDGTEVESIPQINEEEEDDVVKTGDNDKEDKINGKLKQRRAGAKVISTIQKTGQAIPGLESMVKYEQDPRDKTDDIVTVDVGDIKTSHVRTAYNKLLDGTATDADMEILINELPIKVSFKNTSIPGNPITAFSYIDHKTVAISKDPNSLAIFNEQTLPLRKAILEEARKNKSLEGITTNIVEQFPGFIQVDNSQDGVAINSILELQVFDGLTDDQKVEYFQKNTAFVNWAGNLVSTLNPKVSLSIMKPSNKGEVFLKIFKNDGKPYWLKLNVSRISEEKTEAVYEMILALSGASKTIENPGSLQSMTIETFFEQMSERDPELSERIQESLKDEIKLIEDFDNGIKSNRSLARFLQTIVHHFSKNVKTGFNLTEFGNLELGTLVSQLMNKDDFASALTISKDELSSTEAKEVIMNYLSYKRNNIMITSDKADKFTFGNKAYVRHLLGMTGGAPLLTTNAVVNQPTFQGYSNVYLNRNVQNSVKPTIIKTPVTKTTPAVEKLRSAEKLEKAEIEKERNKELASDQFGAFDDNQILEINQIYDLKQKELYDRYDKLITPLLEAEKETTKLIISDADYNNYVDNNIVSDAIILSIAKKIKVGIVLSDREISIQSGKAAEIEIVLKSLLSTSSKPKRSIIPDENGVISSNAAVIAKAMEAARLKKEGLNADKANKALPTKSILELFNELSEDEAVEAIFNLAESLDAMDTIDMETLDESNMKDAFKALLTSEAARTKEFNEIKKICGF